MIARTRLNIQRLEPRTFAMLVVAFFCCLLFSLSPALALNYLVSGQVFQISPEDAADESITDSALTGETWPYVHISIYEEGTSTLLGEADAEGNGQFTVIFAVPFGPPGPNIECRVYKVVDSDSELIPAAREGINSVPGIDQFQGVGLKVVSEELIAYEDAGFCFYPGVGIVFTRVGKVEIPYISQDTSDPDLAGLGNFGTAAAETRAAELGVPAFKQAPFGGRLLIFGDFGLPGGIGCAYAGQEIDFYQVKIQKADETVDPIVFGSAVDFMDPLSKTKTEVVTWPTVSVTHTTQKIGPYNGGEDDPSTVAVENDPISGLYWVDRKDTSGITQVFYSFPDLRLNWVSSSSNGLYRISLRYFKQVGGTLSSPIVQEIPASCFVGSPPSGGSDGVGELILRVSNQALKVHFDHIYLKNGSVYLPDPDTPTDPYDFNSEGLCDIMDLAGTYQVEIHFTAHHEGQYMRDYNLWAISNDKSVTVNFDSAAFDPNNTAADPLWPLWEGTPSTGKAELNKNSFTKECAYVFHLHGISRVQNGYDYVQWSYPYRAYYVKP